MNAGRLDRQVIFERPDPHVDGSGAEVPGWIEHAEVWAEVMPIIAKERIAAPQTMGVRTAKIRIRWRKDITSDMRIRHDGAWWSIDGIAELGRREALEILATAIEGQG